MTFQEIINFGLFPVFGGIAWLVRTMFESLNTIKQDIDAFKLQVSENYVKKSEVDNLRAEMDKRFDRLEQMIARLYDKIDSKVDK
jgi:23S rRNA C2498 (ribose-2'-O)-methylase RlmM